MCVVKFYFFYTQALFFGIWTHVAVRVHLSDYCDVRLKLEMRSSSQRCRVTGPFLAVMVIYSYWKHLLQSDVPFNLSPSFLFTWLNYHQNNTYCHVVVQSLYIAGIVFITLSRVHNIKCGNSEYNYCSGTPTQKCLSILLPVLFVVCWRKNTPYYRHWLTDELLSGTHCLVPDLCMWRLCFAGQNKTLCMYKQ